MNNARRVLALSAAATLALAACGGDSPGQESTDGTTVLAAFYPLAWASEQVLGDNGTVETLTAPGAEAHDLELTPRQIASLTDADLVVYLSGFQPAVDKAIEQSGATNVLDVATVIDLLPFDEEGHSHDHADDDHDHADDEAHDDHDHADDEAHEEHAEEHAEEDGHDHDHGPLDPHFWQDPTRMAVILDALAEKLPSDDASVESAKTALTTLDEAYSAKLATCERREFITTHAAFQYLADRYQLTEIGISGVNPDAEPSPARIAQVHEEAKLHGVTTIFFETLTSDAVASSIAGDLGLKTAVLDPLEGVTDKSPGTDYVSIMNANLESLVAANECS